MNCGCAACRLHDRAFDVLEDGGAPESPEVRAEVIAIIEGRAENAAGEAATCLAYARDDDRFGFGERAAMFRGLAFSARERAVAGWSKALTWRN